MLRVAVCDDDPRDGELVRRELLRYSAVNYTKFDISVFNSPEQLIYELQDGRIADIFILDVAMPGKNGFELAKEIRSFTQTSAIIFLTSMAENATEGYKSRALRYVIKLNIEHDMQEAIDCAVKEVSNSDDCVVTLRRYNDYWRIPYDDIMYVSHIGRQTFVFSKSSGEIADKRGVSEFYKFLGDDRFLFIDRSCFVNIDYISQLSGNDLRLKNGTVLPVSRRLLSGVKQRLLDRWSL